MKEKCKNPSRVIITKEVEHVAKLANITITQNEQEKYSKELNNVINYSAEHLKSIDVKKIKAAAHAAGQKSVIRDDSTSTGLNSNEATSNSSSVHNNLFKIKHIFGEE